MIELITDERMKKLANAPEVEDELLCPNCHGKGMISDPSGQFALIPCQICAKKTIESLIRGFKDGV